MAAEPIDNEPTGADQTIRVIVDVCATLLQVDRSSYDNLQRLLWQNPYGLTPQEVAAALGSKAKALMTMMAAATTLITTLRANMKVPGPEPLVLKPEGVTVTVNADGTVTIAGG
jgi:hypothetical protein